MSFALIRCKAGYGPDLTKTVFRYRLLCRYIPQRNLLFYSRLAGNFFPHSLVGSGYRLKFFSSVAPCPMRQRRAPKYKWREEEKHTVYTRSYTQG